MKKYVNPPAQVPRPGLRASLLARLRHVDRDAPALFDPLDFSVPEWGLQIGAVQLHRQRGELVRPAEGAGLESLLLLPDVPWDVEGVALAVAEAVDDRPALAALLGHGLPQRLGLAPVPPQVLPFCHHQGLLAGCQHLLLAPALD